MPGAKEKCICQICICGQHHCGRDANGFHPKSLNSKKNDVGRSESIFIQCPNRFVNHDGSQVIQIPISIEPRLVDSCSPLPKHHLQSNGNHRIDPILEQPSNLIDGDYSDWIVVEEKRQKYPNRIRTFSRKKRQLLQPSLPSGQPFPIEKIIAKTNTEQNQQYPTHQSRSDNLVCPSPLLLEESFEMKQEQPDRPPAQIESRTNGTESSQPAPLLNQQYIDHSGIDGQSSFTQQQQQQQQHSRKTWETSPKHVEELTRSLSRMRNDERGNRIVSYEKDKFATKEAANNSGTSAKNIGTSTKRSTTTTTGKPIPMMVTKKKNSMNATSMPKKPNVGSSGGGAATLVMMTPNRVPRSVVANGGGDQSLNLPRRKPQKSMIDSVDNAGFLPPLTGFSDSDSSFSSIVCSSEDCDKIHCICETLKKTHLEERHELSDDGEEYVAEHTHDDGRRFVQSEMGINYIDVDNNQWIVTRPQRIRPRDNLKLEGPMEMQTTSRLTYGGLDRLKSAKRSTGGSSIRSNGHMYLNTRRGRHAGHTPLLLRSARRKANRNRPRTSLKLGGHGYWSTNNRDAYKNFIIINGEAKTIMAGQNEAGRERVKLPKVPGNLTKTTMMTSEEKNRCRYDTTMDELNAEDGQVKTMRMSKNQAMKKLEKKSFVADKDGQINEFEAEKLKKKICSKHTKKSQDVGDFGDQPNELEREDSPPPKEKPTPETTRTTKIRPYDAYQVDHIKELGLLEMKSQTDEQEEIEEHKQSDGKYRQHMRRLHETSDDLNLLTGKDVSKPNRSSRLNDIVPKKNVQNQQSRRQQQTQSLVVNGHSVMAASRKPFPLPQKQHKNDSSIGMFQGEMDWTTTSKSSFRNGRQDSVQQRKHTAGRRSQRSGRRRNLFRQSSDSIFARPDSSGTPESTNKANQQRNNGATEQGMVKQNDKKTSKAGHQNQQNPQTIYKQEFGDQSLHCPVLDLQDNFKMTAQTGGHKYFNQIDKI